MEKLKIISYCSNSYPNSYGGVSRFDYCLLKIFPNRKFFKGPQEINKLLEECKIDYLSNSTKIFVNGAWVGVTIAPLELRNKLQLYRRNGLFNIFISIHWNIKRNEILIQTDSGRACHPLLPIRGNEISFETGDFLDKLDNNEVSWNDCLLGFGNKKEKTTIANEKMYHLEDLYAKNIDLVEKSAIIEYLDTQEMESVVLASSKDTNKNYEKNNITHAEVHPSAILSMMANQVIFPSTNPYPRNAFSCGQSKQAVSMFNTNFQNRLDKSALLLNYGQNPLVRSRYYEPITKNRHPYGINAIVAIACYTGYNVEDAVIMNKAALDRGLFRTTYFNMYEAEEDVQKIANKDVESIFMDIEKNDVIGLKTGFDYSKLDPESGLIKENTPVDDKTIVIGKATKSVSEEVYVDESIAPKKGQLGYVDKSILTTTEGGRKLAKIRIRHDRIPAIGDKFCSRAGQKGTIGIVLEESDMPFTPEGLRPDIIVNPHALPSRMTIGHLVEVLIGKACVINGNIGDCTAFNNKGPKEKEFGKVLTQNGFHSTGNEIMYNGMTGEQLETEIYFGPTYYLRLKHMVKDKINYRARGPRTVLTRQTVQGRSNNGGLRVGEMDRDAILAHGMTRFIEESMMERGDKYYMAICNQTGTIAVYNESRNIFLSPMSDGPLKFSENLEGGLNIIPISRFGRDFSIVKVPYAFKLLYQELQAMNVQMRLITSDNIDEITSMKSSDNIIKLTGLTNLEEVAKISSEKLVKDNEAYKEIMTDREAPNEEEFDMEAKMEELAPPPPSPGVLVTDSFMPAGTKVYLDNDMTRIWVIIDGEENPVTREFTYKIRSNPAENPAYPEEAQLDVVQDRLIPVSQPISPKYYPPSPPYQGFAPVSPPPLYLSSQTSPTNQTNQPITPDYPFEKEQPLYDQSKETEQGQLQEDDYDYDTEEEYGFYDPGPLNLEEIIREYEQSKKMREDQRSKRQDDENPFDVGDLPADTNVEQQESNELPSAFDKNFRAFEEQGEDEKKVEPERTVIKKDFQEGLNLLATDDDEPNDENNSGDEDDKKNVSA